MKGGEGENDVNNVNKIHIYEIKKNKFQKSLADPKGAI